MNSLTEENYIKAIYHLSEAVSGMVNTNAIAEEMQTKASSVTDMVKKLAEKKLVTHIPYQGVTLTPKGKKTAIKIIRKHRLWEVFLVEKLKFKWHEVHDIAEELEHIQSDLLIDRLEEFLGNPKADPHGDAIPDKNGRFHQKEFHSIAQLKTGKSGIIAGVGQHSSVFLKYLEQKGLLIGKRITILEIIDFDGSVTLSLESGKEMNISNEIAKNIFIG